MMTRRMATVLVGVAVDDAVVGVGVDDGGREVAVAVGGTAAVGICPMVVGVGAVSGRACGATVGDRIGRADVVPMLGAAGWDLAPVSLVGGVVVGAGSDEQAIGRAAMAHMRATANLTVYLQGLVISVRRAQQLL